jgi:cation transport ATPase
MTKNYKLTDICPSCAHKLESAIKDIEGVKDARINVMSEKLVLECEEEKAESILKEVKKACRRIEPDCVLYAE